jgi:pseudomonalisin
MRLHNRVLRFSCFFFASLLLATTLNAQPRPTIFDPLNTHATSRIGANIENGAQRLLTGNRHPLARSEFDSGAAASDLSMQSMVLVLQSSPEQQAALDALLEAQRDPASPYYHQWLTPGQFAEHFGASTEDVQRIRNWLESQGMRVDEVAASRRAITFSGTAAQVERAFATAMRQYRVKGALHLANATDPSIPAALAPVVHGVLSLHDFRAQAAHTTLAKPEITFGNEHFLTPADLAVIYNLNPLYTQGINGSGQSVAVVARSNIKLSDVHTFRSTFGLPVNDPQVIVNGSDPGAATSGELVEATLDAEYAGALAPNSTVKFVTSASTTSDGVFLSAQYIVNQNLAPVMTMSFGLCEAQMGASGNAFVNSLWQQAAAQGITVLVAAGDSGAADCDNPSSTAAQDGLAVNGICSTPYDLCVGGTEFNDTANPSRYWSANNAASTQASALGYIPEVVWNESGGNLWAGGGGRSILYSKPAWQTGKGVPSDAKRDVPDLSLAAAGHAGYMIVLGGVETVVGGTSAATPALAGVFAMVAQSTGARQGAANPTLYALASQQNSAGPAVFHDITGGNNSVPGLAGFNAGAGYDLASGLGSVDANALVTNWRNGQPAPSIKLTLSTTSLTASASASAPIGVQVAGSGGFSGVVTLSTSGLPRGISGTFSPAGIASPGSGSSSLQLTVASLVAAGSYTFNVVATGGSLSRSAAVTVTVVVPTLTLSASASSISLPPGAPKTITFTSVTNSALNSSVALKAAGLPAGVSGTFSPSTIAAPGSGSSILTLTAASRVQAGVYSVVVTATAGSFSKLVQFTLNLPSLSASASTPSLSIARGASRSLVLTARISGGFNSNASVTVSGLPAGVTVTLSPSLLPAPGAGTSSISLTASPTARLGAASITLSVSGGGIVATVPVALTITPPPTFTFTRVTSFGSTTNPLAIAAGGSATVQFASAAQYGFASTLALSASGAPAGVSLKLSASTILPGQGVRLTIRTPAMTAAATGTVTVTASSGGQSKSATIPFTVTAPAKTLFFF